MMDSVRNIVALVLERFGENEYAPPDYMRFIYLCSIRYARWLGFEEGYDRGFSDGESVGAYPL
jgi:hypothetical protein